MKLGKKNKKLLELLVGNGSSVLSETGVRLKLTPEGIHKLNPDKKRPEKQFIYLGKHSFRMGSTVANSINMERWRDYFVTRLTQVYRQQSAEKNPNRIFSTRYN